MPENLNISEQDPTLEQRIEAATTFGELKEVIRSVGTIQVRDETVDAESIIKILDAIENGAIIFSEYLTRKYGLRRKAIELHGIKYQKKN